MWTVAAILTIAGIVMSRWSPRSEPAPLRRRSSRISLLLLIVYTAATTITFDARDDRAALFTEGLSGQNRMQAAVVLVAASWAFFLITAQRLTISEAFAGRRIWITLLVSWYTVAVLWAITPTLSMYRVLELGTLWVLSMHVFSDPAARRRLIQLLAWMAAAGIVSGLISQRSVDFFVGGVLRDNRLAPIAAILALFGMDALLRRGVSPRRVFAMVVPLWLFVLFDSLATAGSLLLATGLFFVSRVRNGAKRAAAITALAAGILVLLVGPQVGPGELLAGLGGQYGREENGLDSWTGRVPLWQFMFDDVRDHPTGFGLGADRSIALRDTSGQIGWEPLHAHSGYMSALYAGGLLAFLLAVAVMASAFRCARDLDWKARPLAFAVLTVLVVNNLSIVGTGGTASTSWLIVMAVIASGARVFEPPAELNSGNFRRPVNTRHSKINGVAADHGRIHAAHLE